MEQKVEFTIQVDLKVVKPYYVLAEHTRRLIFFGHFPNGKNAETLVLLERPHIDNHFKDRSNDKLKII